MPFFQRQHHPYDDKSIDESNTLVARCGDAATELEKDEAEEDRINLQTLIQGPSIIPRHPTVLSAISGAAAGLVQGVAFTPIENIVR